jgi:hypothetical protein
VVEKDVEEVLSKRYRAAYDAQKPDDVVFGAADKAQSVTDSQ